MERNLTRYPAYATVFAAHFWLPVFFLYFQFHLTIGEILRLEALYYLVVVLTEVPSGYVSDAIGRRITLIIAALSVTVAHGLFFLGDTFTHFAVAQAFLATGMAFNSGTNTALHYDTLTHLNRVDEFDQREARVASFCFLGSGVAALCGGIAATLALRNAYALSFVGGVTALCLAWSMKEPTHHSLTVAHLSPRSFYGKVLRALGELRQPSLRWLTAYGIVMIVLNHIPYELYQPYLKEVLDGSLRLDDATPFTSGVLTLITMLIAGLVARRSIALRDRLGLGATLLLGTALQGLIIAAMAFFVHPVVLLLILLRSAPRAIMTAPRNAAINPLIHEEHRATYLSLESLGGRLAFSATLWGLSALGGDDNLHRILQASAAVAVLGFLALAVTRRHLEQSRL